ncbi:D-glycero-beta-D-manno-heptose 1-phosphate adenylyltransferase [Sediminibacterium sp.]|uniref:D-glycero-beta-D-manno-heptose 1-phosphate adenylyltransferase n=1 Tax=Sediminibacterium sp. TaxID=1917865 RepID=UPI002735D764|nr:D-glycero-beta-D-manno-heptose 1-phosphate adenylyltransferase [Sediminibacterium sp.]MDP3567461.1 D-glycero-beta-D-manno-heptose 1-phosphate adenylyltransferase [Sediminibacterium sp.]
MQAINLEKKSGKKVVFTNGCFDIIHPGHVDYLAKARDLGDYLILGLNTDKSVRLLNKAPNRPLNNEFARAIVLAAFACIDTIVLFDEQTPLELIKFLRPNVLVKGDDYQVEKIVGYDSVIANGGTVVTIPFLEGYSTTKLIEKILS